MCLQLVIKNAATTIWHALYDGEAEASVMWYRMKSSLCRYHQSVDLHVQLFEFSGWSDTFLHGRR